MFNIESYIAPLILSKVEKFVKNINPNEFKVSLWQGDVVFQNLELKLDALEEELQNVPFNFISGHIKNLKIKIPWTKIASESISVTINTLELVVRFKDFSTSSPPPQKKKIKKKNSTEEDQAAGYMTSLVTKIINNISVICNNICVKFIEEDIVFSMNIQHLSIYSADERWRRSFVDHPSSATNILFRKLINIIDLTICIDKRNALGKIEILEPLLYKCSLELRLFRKYNITNPTKFHITRIDLQTKNININISSQQINMIWRLIDLVLALKSRKLQQKHYGSMQPLASSEISEKDGESWLGWMWNLIPTFLLDEPPGENVYIDNKTIFEFGIFIEELTVAIKTQEFISDVIPSAKKAIFQTLLEMHSKEIYLTTVSIGRRKFNIIGGIEFLIIKASPECPCGSMTTEEVIMSAGKSEERCQYTKNTYFDKNPQPSGSKYEDIMYNYYEKYSEAYFFSRSSAIAFDILHTIEIPEDSRSSELGTDLEFSNLSESFVIRFFGNGIIANASADTIHRIEKIIQYYKENDFSSCFETENVLHRNQLSPATADDYDALINEVPLQIITIKLKNSSINLKEWDHEKHEKAPFRKNMRQSNKSHGLTKRIDLNLAFLLDEIKIELKEPLYKNRLVYTTCQLPDFFNNELFKKCVNIVDVVVKNLKVDMIYEGRKRIGEILKVAGSIKNLIYSHLWINEQIIKKSYEVDINGFSLMMNPCQLIVTMKILTSMFIQNVGVFEDFEKNFFNNLNNMELVVIQMTSRVLKFELSEIDQGYIGLLKISDLIGIGWKSGIKSIILNIPDNLEFSHSPSKETSKKSKEMLEINFQFPTKNENKQKFLPIIRVITAEGSINFDPLLEDFLTFKHDEFVVKNTLTSSTYNTKLLNNNIIGNSFQSNSDCDVTICAPAAFERETIKLAEPFLDNFEKYKNYIFHIEMKSLHVFFNSSILGSSKASDSIKTMSQQNRNESLVIILPSIIFYSVKNKSFVEFISPHFKSELPLSLWSNEKCFTWNLVLENLEVYAMKLGKEIEIINKSCFNISIADESSALENKIAGNFLIETSPIFIQLHTSQVPTIKKVICQLQNLKLYKYILTEYSPVIKEKNNTDKLCAIDESSQNASDMDIKEFLGLTTASTITKKSIIEKKINSSKFKTNFYLQWICSKICFTMIADTTKLNKKFVTEIEEVIINLHQQDYYQLKCKVASLAGNFYEKIISDEKDWRKSFILNFNVQSEMPDSTGRFFDMIITKAETVNVHNKWNLDLKRNAKLISNDVTEINLTLQPFDVIADLDELINFLPIFTLFQIKSKTTDTNFMQYSGSDLPLLYFNWYGLRIFLLSRNQEKVGETKVCDVLTITVNSIQITPNVINNLIRSHIVRPDIHSKANMLGILDLVGSKIEDRQYQLIVKDFCLNSSNWDKIASLIVEKNVLGYDNPAERWNNLENGPIVNLQFNTIFKNSSFSIIYAPSITFKNILVAGLAIEINCIIDLNISLKIEEIFLLMNIMKQLNEINFQDNSKSDINGCVPMKLINNDGLINKTKQNFENYHEKRKRKYVDSGVESSFSISKPTTENIRHKIISTLSESAYNNESNSFPFEFTFTSSQFKIKISIQRDNFEIFLDTPNVYIVRNKFDNSMNFSLHDMKIDFNGETIFKTRIGYFDPISGIKPSLLRMKISGQSLKNKELIIQLKRPMMLELSHGNILLISHIVNEFVNQTLFEYHHNKKIKMIYPKERKIEIIKSYANNYKSFTITTDQLCLKIKTKELILNTSIMSSKGRYRIFDRPEKIEANFELIHATVQDNEKIILHPLSTNAKIKISQEYWKKDPQIYINIGINYIKLDIYPQIIVKFKYLKILLDELIQVLQKELVKINTNNIKVKEIDLPKIEILPKQLLKNNSKPMIEYFQDDLRSGAFQFVETSVSVDELPLPYQIQIVDEEIGVICWRYPSPRALHKIKIFPVPFQSISEVTILCKIEYYSQLKSKFEEFISFSLNENETKNLDIKHIKPSSEVWRITIPRVLLKKDSDDEDDLSDYRFQMHPKVLVACLRIDSYYSPNAIPSISSYLSIGNVEINLSGTIKSSLEKKQKQCELVKLNVTSLNLITQHYDEKFENYEVEGHISLDINDFGCGNLIQLVEKFKTKFLISRRHHEFNLNFISEKIQLKYSSAIGYSLTKTTELWKTFLMGHNIAKENEFIFSKYLIVNNTSDAIAINQLDVNEVVLIMPHCQEYYQFYTDKLKQVLQISICVNGTWSLKSKSFSVHHESIEYVEIQKDQYIVVNVIMLNNFQRQITFDGQISVYNMTNEPFRIQYKRYDNDIDTTGKCEVQEIDVGSQNNSSIFGVCSFDSQQSIKLKLLNSQTKLYSGEIPLREIVINSKPWLVKLPSNDSYISFWVRIIRQNVKNEVCRVLVMIWPMFLSRSFFPFDINAVEIVNETKSIITGSGEFTELKMHGTHENDHELELPSQFFIHNDQPANIMLSYKLINKNAFFKISDEFSDITKAIQALDERKTSNSNWPTSKKDENRCIRNYFMSDTTKILYDLSSKDPVGLSCSLVLTLMPWCMMANSTGSLIKITNLSSNEFCFVEANDILIPFYIKNAFTISIKNCDEWIKSKPIYITIDPKPSANCFTLPFDGYVNTIIHHNNQLLNLVISSTCEDKLRFISISSMLVVANHTCKSLKILPFCAELNDKIEVIKRNEIPPGHCVELYKNLNGNDTIKGNPITTYNNISTETKHKLNSQIASFFAISMSNRNSFTCPIKIQPTLRKCLNVPNENESFSINVSIVKQDEQFFVSIFNDSNPVLSVKNNTDFNIFVAQTDMRNPNVKYILPHREIGEEKWLSWFQVVPSKKKVFYTPPSLTEHFPEIVNLNYGIIFACVTGDQFIRWSLPIKIFETKKLIINLPLFGDLKVHVDTKSKTTEININYINSDEEDDVYNIFGPGISTPPFLIETNDNYKKSFHVYNDILKIFNISCYVDGINLTLYKETEEKRVDILSFSIDEIVTNFFSCPRKLEFNFVRIQIDNDLFNSGDYDFPIMLCNKVITKRTRNFDDLSSWNINEIFLNNECFSLNIDFYEHGYSVENVSFKFQPIRVYIEDTFISVILRLFDECIPSIFKKKKMDSKVKLLHDGLVLIPSIVYDQAQHLADVIRLKSIRLEALHILISVHTSMHMYIALDHSPLDFSPYERKNLYTLPLKLGSSVGMHYISSAIFGAGWVVGSLEILGSPSGLARSFTIGFKDFISMPVQGLFKGPWGFLIGLTYGSASLVKNVTTGTVNSVTKLANSLARNLDRLTLDSDHIYLKTDALRRSRPQGFADGLQQGLTGFGISLLGAIGGLARHPLQAKSAVDVFTGVGKGIIGVFTKPISGAAELLALTGSGMLHSVGYNVLPFQMKSNRMSQDNFTQPNAEKISNKQLAQLSSSNSVFFSCKATFQRKNELKHALVVLLTYVLVIFDLENDQIINILMLDKLKYSSLKEKVNNLFIFKIKDETDVLNNEEVDRTFQYVQQLSNQLKTDQSLKNSSEDVQSFSNELCNPENSNNICFYIDEVTGNYLISYFNFIKQQNELKENIFSLLESE